MNQLVSEFFQTYEKAISGGDSVTLGNSYADTFLFAGPHSVQSVRKQDFVSVVPRKKAQFASLGLIDSRVSSVDTTSLDSRYVLAKVQWTMTLRTVDGLSKSLSALATYVLQRADNDTLSIVFQLDHQDLAAVISESRKGIK